jgi:hypothetical protein
VPLRVASLMGFCMALMGGLAFVAVVLEAAFTAGTPRGWASLMAATMLLAGLQLMLLGLMGEYLGRMFLTANKKPQFVVRDVERNESALKKTQ